MNHEVIARTVQNGHQHIYRGPAYGLRAWTKGIEDMHNSATNAYPVRMHESGPNIERVDAEKSARVIAALDGDFSGYPDVNAKLDRLIDDACEAELPKHTGISFDDTAAYRDQVAEGHE